MPHTPGPWTVGQYTPSPKFLAVINHLCVCDPTTLALIAVCGRADDRQSQIDCDLIATAPDLLEACEAQHKAIDFLLARLAMLDPTFFPSQSGQPWEAVTKGHVAIAKARGETP